MSAEIFDMKLYKKALKLAKKGKSLESKPQSSVEYEGEKQIQIDAEQIRALQRQNGELTDKVKELEAQIEEMKRCFNCKYQNKFVESKCGECEGYSKWEIKEK